MFLRPQSGGLSWLLLQAAILLAIPGAIFAQDDLADVIERCEKSVVRIEVEGAEGGSLGSGYVVDGDGTIVTNVHVLSGAQRAIAIFPNGDRHDVLGTLSIDEARDICVARIDATGLAVLPFATDPPRKGETVMALGSPRGLSFTATKGIVSAIRPSEELGPDIGRPEIKGLWIQVDAALSGGNSGGPLINVKGEIVAMSTLASQGTSQNLNFGISAIDIREAVEKCKGTGLVKLPDGVGKLVDKEPEMAEGAIIQPVTVPKDKIAQYVTEGKADFKDLVKGLSREATRATELFRTMRKGKPFIPGGAPEGVEVVREHRGREVNYYFRNDGVKDREVNRQETRSSELASARDTVKAADNADSLFTLLRTWGPRLDTRRKGMVGFMANAIVLHSFNDHDIVVEFEDSQYLMWVESTSGLSLGTELMPGPVYVSGTQTITLPDGQPMSVTILQSLTEAELREAVYGSATAGSGQWRFWKDTTGQYQIEAQLVEVNDVEVTLKKRDGSTVKVPLAKLCAGDLEFLGKGE